MATTKSSNINWSSCSLQDLECVRDQVVKAIAQRESESTLESIDSASNQRYSNRIQFPDRWFERLSRSTHCAPEVKYPWNTEIDDMRPLSEDKTNLLFTNAASSYGCIK